MNLFPWSSLLSKIPLLAEFREDEQALIWPLFRSLELPAGTCLFHQGQPGEALYVLLSGQIQMVQEQDGKKSLLATWSRRGDLLGEMALLGGEPRPGTATVLQPATLLTLHRNEFNSLLQRTPALALSLSRYLSRRLMQTRPSSAPPRRMGKVLVLMGALAPLERVRFVLNLALCTMEQTRRRALLVDVTDNDAPSAVSLLRHDTRTIDPPLDARDFQTIEGIKKVAFEHPSGLWAISISESLLTGPLLGGLIALATTAKQEWDFVFLSLPARPSRAARTLWEEADRTLYVRPEFAEKGGPLWREMEAAVAAPKLDLVELQREAAPRRNRPGRFYIPWRNNSSSEKNGGVFLSASDGSVQRGLERMARHIAGIRIGLAMGAGAALGYSIIGVLRVLERNGIFPDLLAGTSMGALVGSFYAAGRGVDELEEIALSITKTRLWRMADFSLPWKGVFVGNGVLRFLKSILGDTTFDQLRLPFACVATDIHTGSERILRHGAVAEAVRASISLPFFFEPYFWQGRYLVDGGSVNPVPTSVIKAMGADVMISVNITTPPSLKGGPSRRPSAFNPIHGPHIFRVMAKTLYTMQYGIAKAGAEEAHVVIAPGLSDFSWSEFYRAPDIIKIGEEQTERMLPKIRARLPSLAENSRRQLHRPPA